ncbi:MAG: PspC domain-containing protein [Anaerolineales bacterium]|nr:PspC domain-containing protein [Chloroflexota bacterium]MBL6979759.1 PspC domain-containing protein [Anaerolineales bacterium]
MDKKLYRSQGDRMLAGVCGGLADFVGIDATLIRLAFFLLLFGGGVGFWVYLVLWIVIPEQDVENSGDFGDRIRHMGDDFVTAVNRPHPKSGLIVGGGLIILGALWLLESLGIDFLWWLDFDLLWPVLLILAGLAMIFRWKR